MNMLEQIYKDNVKKVYRYAYARLNNTAEAEDITSITFIKLLEQKDLTQINNPGFWLLRVARNAIYDKYRIHSQLNLNDEQIDVIEDEQTDYEQMAISEDQKKQLNLTLFQLSDLQREIVTLKHWEDMSFSEIAELINQKESNVKAIYYSALKKLKINLEKEDRKYAAAAYLFSALAAVVTLAEYQPGEIFLSNLLKSLTMSTTTAAVTSAALSTTAKIALAVGGVSLFTVGTLVGTKINKPQNEVTPVPTVATVEPTVTVEPTIKPTKIVKPTVTAKPTTPPWVTYNADQFDVSLQIPSNWEVDFHLGSGAGDETNYKFIDENGTERFKLTGFDGGVMDAIGLSATCTYTPITVAGIQRNISTCTWNTGGESFSFIYFDVLWGFDATSFDSLELTIIKTMKFI